MEVVINGLGRLESRVQPHLILFITQCPAPRFLEFCDPIKGLCEAHRCVVRGVALFSLSFACNTPIALQHQKRQPERLHDMAQRQDEVIDRIRTFCKDANDLRDDPMELDASDTAARLAKTVRELQARVEEQQAAVETVCHRPYEMKRFLTLHKASITIQYHR